jgi:hypothetical protein
MKTFTIIILMLLSLASCNGRFDKESWASNNNQASNNPRFEMVEDLTNNTLTIGKTKYQQSIDLLGKPYLEYIDTITKTTESKYEIGSNPGMHIDPWYFTLHFDSNGILTKTEKARH